MVKMSRKEMRARYAMFDEFALEDQRNFYKSASRKHRAAARQINRYRALFSFMTGFSAAAAGLIVQTAFLGDGSCSAAALEAAAEVSGGCVFAQIATGILAILAIILPALGALYSTLADLYQWDRQVTIYDAALENIEVADAQSPNDKITSDMTYRAAMVAYAEGALQVMSDETSQWGQAIRTPPQIEQFIAREQKRAQEVTGEETETSKPVEDNPPVFNVATPTILDPEQAETPAAPTTVSSEPAPSTPETPSEPATPTADESAADDFVSADDPGDDDLPKG